MVHFRLTLAALALVAIGVPAFGQVIPPPNAGRQLYIRDRSGKLIERLQPSGNRYDVFPLRFSSQPIGYAKMLGQRLVIYDLRNHVLATIRAELPPPDSDLSVITVVRDPNGHPIGLLERY